MDCDGVAKLIASILRVRSCFYFWWLTSAYRTDQIVLTLVKCVLGLVTGLLKDDVLPLVKEIIKLIGELLSCILDLVCPLLSGVVEAVVSLIGDLISLIFSLDLSVIIKLLCLKL